MWFLENIRARQLLPVRGHRVIATQDLACGGHVMHIERSCFACALRSLGKAPVFTAVALLSFAMLPSHGASYPADVMPRMIVMAFGMALVMAPATESVLSMPCT